MAKRRVLLLGAGGLLGSAFVEAGRDGYTVVTAGRRDLEDRGANAVGELVRRAEPDLVINCAADVDADGAERDPSRAISANRLLPGMVAAGTVAAGAVMVQISSTGCYGAWKTTPYTEEDEPRPTTVHHATKLAGEDAVRQSGVDHLVARVGWLYGGSVENPKNFVWRRLVEARRHPQLASDVDQRGCPGNVSDVAAQVLHAVNAGARGTVNAVCRGSASRFDYVSRIVAASGLACEVVPAPAFARLAPVSANESAVNARLQALGLDIMPAWETAVDDYVARLKADPAWRALGESSA